MGIVLRNEICNTIRGEIGDEDRLVYVINYYYFYRCCYPICNSAGISSISGSIILVVIRGGSVVVRYWSYVCVGHTCIQNCYSLSCDVRKFLFIKVCYGGLKVGE